MAGDHRLMLIVTGAHLQAEAYDRPLAYRLRREMRRRLEHWLPPRPAVLVCGDVWYLNNDELRSWPAISIGPPAVNALTAYLASRLPAVFVVDGVLTVQADPQWTDLLVCCWGPQRRGTRQAVETFTRRYLDDFLAAVRRRERC